MTGKRGTSSHEIADTSNEVDRVLEKGQLAVEGWQSVLDAAQQDLARVTERVISWLMYAAIVITLLLVLAAAGQISLLGRAIGWLRRT
jgi:hypothetical protein